jgi:hypothetical protein
MLGAVSVSTAAELISRMKSDGLVTQRRDGTLLLRTYGREALVALATIAATQDGKTYTLAEVRNGTGWRRGQRFRAV